jgi:transcription termination factor Rho
MDAVISEELEGTGQFGNHLDRRRKSSHVPVAAVAAIALRWRRLDFRSAATGT